MERARKSAGGILLALWLGIAAPCWAQRIVAPQARTGANEQELLNVFLPAPRELQQHLSRAKAAMAEQRFSDALIELSALIDATRDADGQETQDYFIRDPRQPGAQQSLKHEVHRILGAMPPRARELYELQFGAEAKALLEEAVSRRDAALLMEVSRRYFHTAAGYEATVLLGRYELDRGRPLAAALAFQRVVSSPAAGRFEPELSVLLATAWLYSEMPEQARQTVTALVDKNPGARLQIGGQGVSLPGAGNDPLDWLTNLVGVLEGMETSGATQWAVFRGDASRNARSLGGSPLLNHRWRVRTAVDDPQDEQEIIQLSEQFKGERKPALLGLHPLAVRDVVLMRTPRGLFGIDFATGKRVWEFPWDKTEFIENSPSAAETRNSSGLSPRAAELKQRLWNDAPYGQISSDGEAAFFIDNLGFSSAQDRRMQIRPGGFPQINEKAEESHNTLVSVSLPRQGALNWMVGDADGLDEPKLAGAFFLGAPLPLQGRLYAITETKGEVRLVVLDASTGRLIWSQQLAHVEQRTVLNDSNRRVAGASPSFANGVLICPTSAGAVVAVDLATRSLRWGHQYKNTPLRLGGRNPWRTTPPAPSKEQGARWVDGGATITDGKVLLTPIEADYLYCLDLLTGEQAWPAKRRGSMLYVACVHKGKAIVVGSDSITAFNLADGEPAWDGQHVDLGDGLPSGRGFYSDHYFYVPTTAGELLKVDLDEGRVEQRVDTGEPLGNLVCYKDQIISQGPQWLSVFYQLQPLRQLVAQRLENDPSDLWALSRQGELMLHDGDRGAALQVLRKAHKLAPEHDEIRAVLVKIILAAVTEDFPAHRAIAEEFEHLIVTPQQRAEYLRAAAIGRFQLGELIPAFEAYLQLAEIHPQSEAAYVPQRSWLVDAGPDLRVRHDRWVRARLAALLETADDKLLKAMDDDIAGRLEEAVNRGDGGSLQRFIDYFGAHPLADKARLSLASVMLADNDLLRAELLAGPLASADDPAMAGRALAVLAQVYRRARRFDLAADGFTRLGESFADIECSPGITGRQLAEEATRDPQLKDAFDAPNAWPNGEVTWKSGPDTSRRFGGNYGRALYPFPLTEVRGLPSRIALLDYDRSHRMINVRDAKGAQLLAVPMSRPDNRSVSSGQTLFHGQLNGHLLLLSVGVEVVAVDTLHAARAPNEAIRWRRDVLQPTPGSSYYQSVQTKSVDSAFGERVYYLADTSGRRIGVTGPLNADGVCFQKNRQLICVDPASGETIWIRNNIERGSDVYGDSEVLLVTPPNSSQTLVLRASDGELIGERVAPRLDARWTTYGRQALTWESGENGLVLQLVDPWLEKTVWQREFTAGSKGTLVQQDEVAVMQPDGRFVILQIADGRARIEADLAAEPALQSIHVLRGKDDYILAANRPATEPLQNRMIQSAPPDSLGKSSPLLSGKVYAFDAESGRARWPSPASVERFALPLDQPTETPVIAFLRQVSGPGARNRNAARTEVLCLDRRDGRILLYDKNAPVPPNNFQMIGSSDNTSVRLVLPGKTYSLTFTDDPTPPAPPAQFDDQLSRFDPRRSRADDFGWRTDFTALGLPPAPIDAKVLAGFENMPRGPARPPGAK